jgi:squalene-associated FAD-dependent desaturase
MDSKRIHQDSKRVIVLGGGLAGMAAACHLLDAGHSVVLVEKRPFLGGRAYSFKDHETHLELDNGQHVFLGCCEVYLQFLRKLGTYSHIFIQPRLQVEVFDSKGRKASLSALPLPPPFNLLLSFLGYSHLSLRERVLAIYALICIRFSNRKKPSFMLENFDSWLKRHYQSEGAINRFWNLITLPSLNDHAKDVSTDWAMMVLQRALLLARNGGNVGYPKVGLSALMGEAAVRYIQERGGKIIQEKSVSHIEVENSHVVSVELSDGQLLKGDIYINALPFDVLLRVLPTKVARAPFFAGIKFLQWSPIVGLYIWYDRPVADFDFAGFVGGHLQWVFDKTRIYGQDESSGQCLYVSLSGAWSFIKMPKEELKQLLIEELACALPRARKAKIERLLVVKQPQATFRSIPGSNQFRPGTVTPLSNFLLAGDWTDTGWPSTMEGAVRSGIRAAHQVSARGQ